MATQGEHTEQHTAEPAAPTSRPASFELWSDKVKQTPDASRSEVKKILTEIEEELGRAESMKVALHTAMFGA